MKKLYPFLSVFIGEFNITKRSILCLMISAVFVAVANAAPILTYSLVQDGTSATNLQVELGQIITLDILATLPSDGWSGDGVNFAALRFTGTENGVWGTFSDATLSSDFTYLGNAGVAYSGGSYTAGNKGTDWGGAYPTTSVTGYYMPASASAVAGTMIDASDMQVLLGKINFTVNPGSDFGTDILQIVPFVNSATGRGSFSYYSNGLHYSNVLNGGSIAVGEPIIFIPEPSTSTLLGVGAISLLAYTWRRRKRGA